MQLILDLDETLLHTFVSKPDKYDFEFDNLYVLFRRGLRKFLHAQEHIIVWSAGDYKYVHTICKEIQRRFKVHIELILTRDDCESRITDNDSFYTKPLVEVFKRIPSLSYNDTFLLDDRPENMFDSPWNHIYIKPFTGEQDNELLNVLRHFD